MNGKVTKGIEFQRERVYTRRNGLTNGLTNGYANGLTNGLNGKALWKSHEGEKKHGKILAERRGLGRGRSSILPKARGFGRGRSPILAVAVLCFLVLGVFAVLTYQNQQRNTIAIDGNFEDWQGVAKQSKERTTNVPENIDISEYASTESGKNVAFYTKVYGNMLYGDGRYIVEVPDENPVYVAEIRENAIPNANGRDVAYVFIDTDNNANTGFKPSEKFAVGADRAIEVVGKNGKIEASRVLEFAGTVPYEWNWIVKQSVDAATNGKQMETMASKSVLGIGEKYAVYFYMVDWQGKECKVENALKFENAKVSLFGLYLAEQATVRTENAIMGIKGTPHAPIHINGNTDFASQASSEGWSGDGTGGNPYIIGGYDINGNAGAYCIWIENTDVWFVIQNCNLYGATDFPTEPHGVGISLKNVQNGTLVNNNCYSNNLGIFLYNYACNNTITNNNCSDSIYHGIMLYFSTNNNTLTNNDLYHNANYGIYILSSSTENTIYHNNFYQNNGAGKGVNGNCQAYDSVGGNYWYDDTAQEGNYWSNWDGSGWGTPNAYPIDGGAGAYDMYPSGQHGPIHINGNPDFANQATTNGWPGDGTQGNPYIIGGYEIDGNGGPYCIWIENTDVWFVVRNCKLWNATNTASEPWGTGIYLYNVQHGTLANNNCSGNSYGIYLYSSTNNTVTNNNCFGNFYGIYLYSSSNNNTITNNNCSGNSYGIYLYYYSSNNNITNNNCPGNSYDGIYLYSSSNNNITNNNCSGNSQHGIRLYFSSNNNITNNNCSSNSYGIYLDSSSNNNTITNNNCPGNSYDGIYLDYSSNNNITYNNFYHNTNYAIYISSSSTGNIIHHNNFYQNNGAAKGVNGNCQAYDENGGNIWYDNSVNEGNYWSNWDGNGNGTASAYPIAGGAGAYDMYPLSNPAPELSPIAVIALAIALLGIAAMRRRK